jgi:hypothetical protein
MPYQLRKETIMFNEKDKVIIRDPNNFYCGREATLVVKTDWPNVWNARIDNIFFCINEKNMEAVQ